MIKPVDNIPTDKSPLAERAVDGAKTKTYRADRR